MVTRLATDQIASGSATSGQAPLSNGDGTATWGDVAADGGGVVDMLTDVESQIFATDVGDWVESAGSIAHATDEAFCALAGTLQWTSPTTNNDYLECPIPGTFLAGVEYHAAVAYMVEESVNGSANLTLGDIGTDSATADFTWFSSGSFGVADRLWSLIMVRWTPSADRTGVTLRLVRTNATGAQTFHLGYARVVQPNGTLGLAQFTDARLIDPSGWQYGTMFIPLGDGTGAFAYTGGGWSTSGKHPPALRMTGGSLSLSGGNGEDSYVSVSRSGDTFISGGDTTTFGDKIQVGVNIEIAPYFAGFYIGLKDDGSVAPRPIIQFYADFDDYDFEFADGADGRWMFRSNEDGYGIPSMGMLPQYASAPHVGTETEGESYYDTTLNKNRTWDGSAWQNWW